MLHIRLRICLFKGSVEPGKPIKNTQQHFLRSAVVQVFKDLPPAVRTLLTSHIEPEDLTLPHFVDAHRKIDNLSTDGAPFELHVQPIQVDHGVALAQWSFLPLVDIVKDGSGNVADGRWRVMTPEHAFNKTGHIPGPHARFIHLDHSFLKPTVPPLVRLKHPSLEETLAVAGNLQILQVAVFRVQVSRLVSVAAIACTCFLTGHERLGFSTHNGFHVLFYKLSDKIFK